MKNIRRYFGRGQICFLTHITHRRQKILADHFDLLWHALQRVSHNGIRLTAWSVMPDHLHMLVETRERNLSDLMRRFKVSFSMRFRHRTGKKGEVWQHRFWDRIVRSQEELAHYIDYIHYNPVKHGLADSPFSWEYSSARDYLRAGYYLPEWGGTGPKDFEGDFGE
jgi:putative transposase